MDGTQLGTGLGGHGWGCGGVTLAMDAVALAMDGVTLGGTAAGGGHAGCHCCAREKKERYSFKKHTRGGVVSAGRGPP